VTVPTLILDGEHESRSVFRHAAHLQTMIPSAEAHVIPGAGHVSTMENAAGFNERLCGLLAQVHGR
jgi:pimeloyl-ACP methyl ester carboxylesterase